MPGRVVDFWIWQKEKAAGKAAHCLKIFITPADEKTHGFNRVDDSPQIF